jgi:predicted Zn-ribbon and HTH transcriptional regulator
MSDVTSSVPENTPAHDVIPGDYAREVAQLLTVGNLDTVRANVDIDIDPWELLRAVLELQAASAATTTASVKPSKACASCGNPFTPHHHLVAYCPECRAARAGSCLVCDGTASAGKRFCGECWGNRGTARWLCRQWIKKFAGEAEVTTSESVIRAAFKRWVEIDLNLAPAMERKREQYGETVTTDLTELALNLRAAGYRSRGDGWQLIVIPA